MNPFVSPSRQASSTALSLILILGSLAAPPVADAAHYRVIILAGQSNASGRANKSALPASPIDASVPYFYDFDTTANRASRVTSNGVFSTLQTRGDNFGPEFTLCRTLYSAGATDIALIKTSLGGTTLALDWRKGATTGQQLYSRLVTNVQTALADLTSKGHTHELVALFWMQGESDTGANAAAYVANLTAFVANLRTDLNAPRLPFFIGRIAASVGSAGDRTAVRDAQLQVAGADLRADWVDTDGLGLLGDGLHFNGAGQLGLGTRFANAFLKAQSFAQWRDSQFTPEELADPEISGPAASPAGDHLANLTKYHLGLDPRKPVSTVLQPTLSEAGDQLVVSYLRSRHALEADAGILISPSLAAESWQTGVATERILAFSTDHELVEAAIPRNGSPALFVRLYTRFAE